jgi:hypothetical protein
VEELWEKPGDLGSCDWNGSLQLTFQQKSTMGCQDAKIYGATRRTGSSTAMGLRVIEETRVMVFAVCNLAFFFLQY